MKKSKKKKIPVYTACRFAALFPSMKWPLENITGQRLKEIDRNEAAYTVEEWMLFIYNHAILKGRRLQYETSALQLNRTLLGPHP